MIQNKRTAFTDANYNARTNVAVPNRLHAPRSFNGKKMYKPTTYDCRNIIWKRQINYIYV